MSAGTARSARGDRSLNRAAEEVRRKSPDEIDAAVLLLKKQRFNLRFQKATGQLENTSTFRKTRREIARHKTILAQKKAGASKNLNRPLAKTQPRRQDAAKHPKNVAFPVIGEELQGVTNGSSLPSEGAIQLVRDLRAHDGQQRIAAMYKLQQSELNGSVAKHGATRLIPLLVSRNQDEAIEAAITLCKLTFPNNYKGRIERQELLERVGKDLPKALHDRRIDYMTHVHAEAIAGGKVRVHARLSDELPFTLNGGPTRLQTPDWIRKADDFAVVVSGPSVDSKSIRQKKATLQEGDIGAFVIECKVRDKGERNLTVDFIMDNQILKRKRISF